MLTIYALFLVLAVVVWRLGIPTRGEYLGLFMGQMLRGPVLLGLVVVSGYDDSE